MEVLEEDALNSVLRRLTGLEKDLKQWKWIVLILYIYRYAFSELLL